MTDILVDGRAREVRGLLCGKMLDAWISVLGSTRAGMKKEGEWVKLDCLRDLHNLTLLIWLQL